MKPNDVVMVLRDTIRYTVHRGYLGAVGVVLEVDRTPPGLEVLVDFGEAPGETLDLNDRIVMWWFDHDDLCVLEKAS